MNPEHIPAIFMDTDYLDRTVLRLITQGDFDPLLKNEKVFAFIDELWVGKLTNQCDGKYTDFSLLTFMASAPIKKLPGQTLELSSILGLNFEREIEKDQFSIQYRFRKISIAYIFTKELGWTIAVCTLFIIINYQYLTCFNVKQWAVPFATIDKMKPLLDQEHVYWTEEYYKPNILYPLRKGISVDLVNLGNVTLTGEHKDKM